jgi:hypothetical protein
MKMRKYSVISYLCLLSLFMLPSVLKAQELPLPPCCRNNSLIPPGDDLSKAEGFAAQFSIADDVVRLMGISRAQFVDRLADALFPKGPVEMIFARDELITQPSLEVDPIDSEHPLGEHRLIAIQQRRFYQIPRSLMDGAAFDALEQLYLTDGVVYVSVRFVGSPHADTTQAASRPR